MYLLIFSNKMYDREKRNYAHTCATQLSVWQCRYQIDGKWQRESTKQRDLDKAKAVAHDLFVEANVRKKLKASPITRAFKDIAKQAILRMEKQIEDGDGKVMYKEYISKVSDNLIRKLSLKVN